MPTSDDEPTDPHSDRYLAQLVEDLVKARELAREDFLDLCKVVGLDPLQASQMITSYRSIKT